MTLGWFCLSGDRVVRRNCRVRFEFGGSTVLSASSGHQVSLRGSHQGFITTSKIQVKASTDRLQLDGEIE